MSFQSIIKFSHEGNEYLTVQSSYAQYAHDMVISSIYSLLALLDFSEHRFDDDLIDHMIRRVDELRYCPHEIEITPPENSEHVMDAVNYLTCK